MIGHLQNGGCWPPHGSLTPTEDLSEPPSLAATVLSRSACDWTEVSLSLLPVIALPCGATAWRCTLREVSASAFACRRSPAALPGNSRNVFCKGLFSFLGAIASERPLHQGSCHFRWLFVPFLVASACPKATEGRRSPHLPHAGKQKNRYPRQIFFKILFRLALTSRMDWVTV